MADDGDVFGEPPDDLMLPPMPRLPVADGVLLVAAPALRDPNFMRTVIYVLDSGGDGVTGVVLNRPSEVPVGDVLPSWSALASAPGLICGGGPVEPTAALCLSRVRPGRDPGGWREVANGVGVTDLDVDPVLLAADVAQLRVFAGYAGWAPDQLGGELAEGAWFVVPGGAGDVFTHDPDDLWRHVLERQGGVLGLVSTVPSDPRLN